MVKPGGAKIVDRYTSHETFSPHIRPCAHITLWFKVSQRVSDKNHSCTCHHMFERLLFHCFVFFLSLSRLYFLSHCLPVLCPAHQLPCGRQRRGLKPLYSRIPLTGYEPKQLDNFDFSETSAAIFQDESGDIDTEPSYLCDVELDDETIGKALSSTLFIEEREEPANLRQAYHSYEESSLPAQSFCAHTSTGRPVHEPSSYQKRKSGRDMESERIRILLERQKDQILAEVRTEIQKHEFQADSDRRSIQELNGIIAFQRREIDHTITSDYQSRRDQLIATSRTIIRTKSGSS